MRKQTTTSVDAVPAAVGAPTASIETLVARGGDLKGELVAFAQTPRFSKQLTALLRSAADRHGYLDENTAVLTIDHFMLQYRLPDGRTVLERFVAQRRPPLSDDECEVLLGWRDVVEGCFEVCRLDQSAVVLHNLVDDLVYRVHSTMGGRAFTQLRKGMFVIGRIVPVHPATDAWLVSGHFAVFPKSAGRQIAQTALQTLTAHPELLRRNPDKLRRAWEIQAEDRADFIALFGSDLVVLPPEEAQQRMREHYHRRLQKAGANRKGKAAERAEAAGPNPEELGRLPEELLDADDIAVVYDEVEGLSYYRDFGRLDALFAEPALAHDRMYVTQLREYLQDESVSPLAIRRLVQRHPEGADQVFRVLLRKPGFCWERDGERLLRRWKKTVFDREPTPSISTVGDRLIELLRTGGREAQAMGELSTAQLEAMIEQATVDANDEHEQLAGFYAVISDHLEVPFDTIVLGVNVTVEAIDLLTNGQIVARCSRGPHRQAIGILDLPLLTPAPQGAEWIEAYRHWAP